MNLDPKTLSDIELDNLIKDLRAEQVQRMEKNLTGWSIRQGEKPSEGYTNRRSTSRHPIDGKYR